MKIFGWVLISDNAMTKRRADWYAIGYRNGWFDATQEAAKTFAQHGFTVLATTADLKGKLNLPEESVQE